MLILQYGQSRPVSRARFPERRDSGVVNPKKQALLRLYGWPQTASEKAVFRFSADQASELSAAKKALYGLLVATPRSAER
ncbi:hypothetical protein PWG14_25375 [Chromobacterium amazonense]|nr:hypothetical protein [Chromobacterium amazonense]